MKFVNKLFLIVVCIAISNVSLQSKEDEESFDEVKLIHETIQKTAKRIADAVINKNNIMQSYLNGKITRITKDLKIAEQDDIINTAKRQILDFIKGMLDSANEIDKQRYYSEDFLASAQNLGTKIVISYKPERDLAKAIITELENLKKTTIDPKVIKAIDDEIYSQKIITGQEKIITGQELSIEKKLLYEKLMHQLVLSGLVEPAQTKEFMAQPEELVKNIRAALEQATKEAAKRIADAVIKKNNIQQSYPDGKITSVIDDLRIAEQDRIINSTKQELLKLTETSIEIADETEKEKSYLEKFLAGAQNLGAKVIAPFKAGYGSQQEKDLAQAIIAELENLKKTKIDPKVIKAIDDEIYKQKVITGQELGLQKKLLIGAAVAAAALAGVALASRYFSAPIEEPDTSITANLSTSSIPSPAIENHLELLESELANKQQQRSQIKSELQKLYDFDRAIADASNNNQEHANLMSAIKELENCISSNPSYGNITISPNQGVSIDLTELGTSTCQAEIKQYKHALNSWQQSEESKVHLDLEQKIYSMQNDLYWLNYEMGILRKRISEARGAIIIKGRITPSDQVKN